MTLQNTQAIILAAGKSTRFGTGKSKLLEKICGQEMILYPTKLLESLNIPTTLVVGYQKEQVIETVSRVHGETVTFVTQEKQEGTGHAILCTKSAWNADAILIINGDCPLVTKETIAELYEKHIANDARISFVIAHNADPSLEGYGRVITENETTKIVEAKEFTGDANVHCCINAGIYLVNRSFLQSYLDTMQRNKTSNEFYFTDIIKVASDGKLPINMVVAPFDRVRGINTLQELWIAEQIKRAELIKYWMERGVHFSVAQNVHIDLSVTIGAGSRIGCGAHLLGNTSLGKNCDVQEFSSLENATMDDDATVYAHCIVSNSHIGSQAKVGPFAHIRNHTVIGKGAVVGNFVEIKNSIIGDNTRAKHLTYLGDAEIGTDVNIGAGTITCNFDGTNKHKTTIKDRVTIGSNNALVAPVTIESEAYTAAGSTITHDVPAGALAIARSRQVNKLGYAYKLRDKANNPGSTAFGTDLGTDDESASSFSFSGAVSTDKLNIPDNV